MDQYDPLFAPPAFGLANTGAICYLNAFLQALAGCTAFTRAVLAHAPYLRRTLTGAAVHAFVQAYATPAGARAAPAEGVGAHSAKVLEALRADLAARRPQVRFGAGQESASEALAHLLDMMEPEGPAPGAEGAEEKPAPGAEGADGSPITRLFLHRFRCDLHCRACQRVVSKETDHSVAFNLFHFDRLREAPATPGAFADAVRRQVSVTEGYACEACHAARQRAAAAAGADPAAVPAERAVAFRVYNLTMVPEILFCSFNLYEGHGGARRARPFPERLEFPAAGGGHLAYRLVAQIEHAGSLSGGHYWARGRRAGDRVLTLNDTHTAPTVFAPTPGTYLVAYHYAGAARP